MPDAETSGPGEPLVGQFRYPGQVAVWRWRGVPVKRVLGKLPAATLELGNIPKTRLSRRYLLATSVAAGSAGLGPMPMPVRSVPYVRRTFPGA